MPVLCSYLTWCPLAIFNNMGKHCIKWSGLRSKIGNWACVCWEENAPNFFFFFFCTELFLKAISGEVMPVISFFLIHIFLIFCSDRMLRRGLWFFSMKFNRNWENFLLYSFSPICFLFLVIEFCGPFTFLLFNSCHGCLLLGNNHCYWLPFPHWYSVVTLNCRAKRCEMISDQSNKRNYLTSIITLSTLGVVGTAANFPKHYI